MKVSHDEHSDETPPQPALRFLEQWRRRRRHQFPSNRLFRFEIPHKTIEMTRKSFVFSPFDHIAHSPRQWVRLKMAPNIPRCFQFGFEFTKCAAALGMLAPILSIIVSFAKQDSLESWPATELYLPQSWNRPFHACLSNPTNVSISFQRERLAVPSPSSVTNLPPHSHHHEIA